MTELTICMECKHYYCFDPDDKVMFKDSAACLTSPVTDTTNYITGEPLPGGHLGESWIDYAKRDRLTFQCPEYYYCQAINTSGRCPKFERKEQ